MAQQNAHSLYGSTDDSSCVPGALVYDAAGHPVSSESFRKGIPHGFDTALGHHLADALTVWDCYADRRMEGAPLLLRFEAFDLACSTEEGNRLTFWQGAVDTSRSGRAAPHGAGTADDDRFCPAWIPVPALADVIGSAATGVIGEDGSKLSLRFDTIDLIIEGKDGTVSYRLLPKASVL